MSIPQNKQKLPFNYYESVMDLENKLIYDKSMENIEILTNLYKIGIEYYSDYSSESQKKLMIKLHDLLMDKKNLKIIDQSKSISPSTPNGLKRRQSCFIKSTISLNQTGNLMKSNSNVKENL
jgi:hypothetical protein